MKLRSLIMPAAAFSAAMFILGPESGQAYTLLGYSLGTTQRGVRIFDNFTAAGAHNNTTPHANWPGYTEVEMAFWKGVTEWGSSAFGNGTGDPTQSVVGSGGANFDVHWGGEANGVGGIGQNIISQIAGSSGGVLAFQQGNGGGWWIRFYQNWNWADGPGFIGGNEADLQGICTHEYGHALGLGHSNVGNATMFASASLGSVTERSIEADDIAGLKAIYGTKSASKPLITSVSGGGANLMISGTNFPATVQVWFTRSGKSSTGTTTPLSVSGVPTTGGTSLTVAVPAGAGPGNVLIKNQSSGAGSALSNAFPFDPQACVAPVKYCTAKTNSLGCVPSINGIGTPSVGSTSGFFINCVNVRNYKSGMLVYSVDGAASSPFLGGTLCVATQIKRSPTKISNGNAPPVQDCSGVYLIDFAQFAAGLGGGNPVPALQVAGTPVWAQWWSRDQGFPAPNNIGLSDGLSFTMCP